MTNTEAIQTLRNAAWLGNDADREKVEQAVEIAVEAMQKQIPRRVRITTSTKRCRNCGRQLSGIGNIHPERNYCVKCGQAIDWEGEG